MSHRPARLLVSVRSVSEAIFAERGGASIIDVKEPSRGPLGMADPEVWRAIRNAVRETIPVSVALGELADWIGREPLPRAAFDGLAFRKIGLARSGARWAQEWATLRESLGEGPAWIAVIYADWERAKAPDPDSILQEARLADCAGVLIDTWDKTRSTPLDPRWVARVRRIRGEVGIVALAGGLDESTISELRPFEPDFFAVRGAACDHNDRLGQVSSERVAALVRACNETSLHVHPG